MLIRRNQRTLETLEEKYLTRSSSALADHVALLCGRERELEKRGGASLWLAGQLTGKDPFTSADGPRILGSAPARADPAGGLARLNVGGAGSFVGPDMRSPEIDYEFRKGFESARDGVLYQGKPFFMTPELGAVAVLAVPVLDEIRARSGVVEALVSWAAICSKFRDQAHRESGHPRRSRRRRDPFRLRPRPGSGATRSSSRTSCVSPPRDAVGATPRGAVLASIAPVRQPDWGVLVERDRDLAFASVHLMVRDTVIWSAVALAAALLLGLFFARGLSTSDRPPGANPPTRSAKGSTARP